MDVQTLTRWYSLLSDNDKKCIICYDEKLKFSNIYITPKCVHVFCKECVIKTLNINCISNCPLCNTVEQLDNKYIYKLPRKIVLNCEKLVCKCESCNLTNQIQMFKKINDYYIENYLLGIIKYKYKLLTKRLVDLLIDSVF